MNRALSFEGKKAQGKAVPIVRSFPNIGSVARYGILCLFLWGIFLGFGKNSLDAPFHHDTLHLVRAYSLDELLNAWRGKWDPDGIETPGFRPLTTLFYHLEARLLGESPKAHRIFLIGLFSLFLTLAVALASLCFGISFRQGVLAGLFSFLHIDNFIHYTWISDGIHLVCEICTIGSILALLLFLEKKHWLFLAASFFLVAAGLFTRESGLVAYPLLVLFGLAYWLHRRPEPEMPLRALFLYGAALLCLLVIFWILRSLIVPDRFPLRFSGIDYLWSLKEILLFLGDSTHLVLWMPNYILFQSLWMFFLGTLFMVYLFLIPRSLRTSGGWLVVAALIAAAPGFTFARSNLLLLPITFFSFFIATVLSEFTRKSFSRLAAVLIISFLFISAGAKLTSEVLEEQRSPNLDWINIWTEWVYGKYSFTTIPEPRLKIMKTQLNSLGIYSVEDRDRKLPLFIREAVQKRWFAEKEAPYFIPKFRRLIDPHWKLWSTVGREGWIMDSPSN